MEILLNFAFWGVEFHCVPLRAVDSVLAWSHARPGPVKTHFRLFTSGVEHLQSGDKPAVLLGCSSSSRDAPCTCLHSRWRGCEPLPACVSFGHRPACSQCLCPHLGRCLHTADRCSAKTKGGPLPPSRASLCVTFFLVICPANQLSWPHWTPISGSSAH